VIVKIFPKAIASGSELFIKPMSVPRQTDVRQMTDHHTARLMSQSTVIVIPMSTSLGRRVFLPIELPSRELLPKVLLASFACREGLRPVVGSLSAVLSLALRDGIPGDVYLHNGGIEHKWASALKSRGLSLVVLDEETSPSGDARGFVAARISPAIVPLIDLYISGSRDYGQELQAVYPEMQSRIRVVGFPRLDLLHPLLLQRIVQHSGAAQNPKQVLICSSFGVTSLKSAISSYVVTANYESRHVIDSIRRNGATSGFTALRSSLKRLLRGFIFISISMKHAKDFARLLPSLCETRKDLEFVLRPHPGEEDKLWREIEPLLTNLVVRSRLPLEVELAISTLHIHLGSTTSVQARSVGVPTLSLARIFPRQAPNDADLDSILPDTKDELISFVRSFSCLEPPQMPLITSDLVTPRVAQAISGVTRRLTWDGPGAKSHSVLPDWRGSVGLPGASVIGRLLRRLDVGQPPARERGITCQSVQTALSLLGIDGSVDSEENSSECFSVLVSPAAIAKLEAS
jgi:surface carbohydrate biosynthesis protein